MECGRLQQLLAVLLLRRLRRQAMQLMEGSEWGLISLSQRQDYLLSRGQSNANFCLKPDRSTQRSRLDEITVSS